MLVRRKIIKYTEVYVLMAIIFFVFLFPLVWTFLSSIKHPLDLYKVSLIFKPYVGSYKELFVETNFALNLINSIIVSVAATGLIILVGSPCAYSMARFKIGGKSGPLTILMLRMVPPIVPIIPIYFLYRQFGLIDTRIGLILLYAVFNLPLYIWIMIGFFEALPMEMEEAASLDGCSTLGIFGRISFPLAIPGLVASAALCFIFCWNEFLFALILTHESAKTAPVAITGLISHLGIPVGKVSAAGSLIAGPAVLFILLFQKYIVKGLAYGSAPEV